MIEVFRSSLVLAGLTLSSFNGNASERKTSPTAAAILVQYHPRMSECSQREPVPVPRIDSDASGKCNSWEDELPAQF